MGSHRGVGLGIDGRQSSKSCVHNVRIIDTRPMCRSWVAQLNSAELKPTAILHLDGRHDAPKVYGRESGVIICTRDRNPA